MTRRQVSGKLTQSEDCDPLAQAGQVRPRPQAARVFDSDDANARPSI